MNLPKAPGNPAIVRAELSRPSGASSILRRHSRKRVVMDGHGDVSLAIFYTHLALLHPRHCQIWVRAQVTRSVAELSKSTLSLLPLAARLLSDSPKLSEL
jgi:hypothetical protein